MALFAPTAARPAAERATQTGRAVGAWLLGGVVLLAVVLRFWGINWQLPHALYYDEFKYAGPAARSALKIEGEKVDYRNPSLFRHLLDFELRQLNPHLARPADQKEADYSLQTSAFLVARLTSALLGSASVVLLYVVGRKALGPSAGLLAAGLLAVNFLHVHLSHFGLNDVPAMFFLVASLIPAVALLDRPTPAGYLLAGLLGGMAAAAKYNFGFVVAVPLAIWLLHAARRSTPLSRLVLGPVMLGLGGLAGFAFAMPEIIHSFREVQQGFMTQASLADQRWDGQERDAVPLLFSRTLVRAFGLPGVLAMMIGLILLLWRRTALAVVLLAGPLLYLTVMLNSELFFARFALPLVPFGCLFAAYGLLWLWSRFPISWRRKPALLLVGSLVVLGWPLLLSIRLNLLTSVTDTRTAAWDWSVTNIPTGASVATQIYAFPAARPGDPFRLTHPTNTFGSLSANSRLREVACEDEAAEFVLTASFQYDREQVRGNRRTTGYETLETEGEHLITFTPGHGGSNVRFHVDDTGLPFWQLEQYAQPGPTVNVYRLPPGFCQR
jgi:hypothetical protein